MSNKLSTFEALQLTATAAKGYISQQIANLVSTVEGVLEELSQSVQQLESDVDGCHTVISQSLPASSWTTSAEGVYTQTFTNEVITAEHQLEIAMDTASLQQLMVDGVTSIRADNNDGTPTVIALGAQPSVDLTVQVTLFKIKQI